MVALLWGGTARADLQRIRAYIAEFDPDAAGRIADRIRRSSLRLIDHPMIGRPGRRRGTRELIITGTPWLVAYRITPDAVEVLRVLHGRQRWPAKLHPD